MTVEVDIITLGILVIAIIFAALLLPMIRQWRKTGQEADALLVELRRELIPTLKDFREITERINRASVKIEKGSGHAENLVKSLDEIVESVRQVSHGFRHEASHLAENAACLMTGIRVAIRVFSKENQD